MFNTNRRGTRGDRICMYTIASVDCVVSHSMRQSSSYIQFIYCMTLEKKIIPALAASSCFFVRRCSRNNLT